MFLSHVVKMAALSWHSASKFFAIQKCHSSIEMFPKPLPPPPPTNERICCVFLMLSHKTMMLSILAHKNTSILNISLNLFQQYRALGFFFFFCLFFFFYCSKRARILQSRCTHVPSLSIYVFAVKWIWGVLVQQQQQQPHTENA